MNRGLLIRVGGAIAIASLALGGCAQAPRPKVEAQPARPLITQAQVDQLMKNHDAINNEANGKRDPKLMATIEDGDLLAQDAGIFSMMGRVRDKTPYEPFTFPKPIAFMPPAGGYPQVFFVYSRFSPDPKANVVRVLRRPDAAAPWKSVISADTPDTLPMIAVDATSGLATIVAPTASGYAFKPIDVAPLLAKAMISLASPAGRNFESSPILTTLNKAYADDQAAVKGKGTATRTFTPTKDIYAIKTTEGALVMGGMVWQQALSFAGAGRYTPRPSDESYSLHPGPIKSFSSDYFAIWAVQVPVKGPMTLVCWNSSWVNFSAS